MPSKLKGDIQESREECWDELLASRCGVKALRNLRITTQQDHMSPQPRRLFDKTFATIRSSYQKILNSTVAKTVYGVYGMGELRVVMTTWTEAMAGTEADLFFTSSGRAAVSQYLLDAEREMKGYGVEINRTKAGILSLENKKNNQEDLDCVFLNITLPDLSSLKISGKDDKDDKPDEPWTKIDERSISDFVQGSACSITSLCLRWLPLTDPQTITLLRLLPELGTLHIEEQVQAHSYRRTNKIVTSAFAKQLAMDLVDTPSTPFLPRLKDLTFVIHNRGLNQQGLSNAIISRWLPRT
uniref:Uncharacterized protein n=1 Tax=Moniliophthora roreri TaxID=221103 RepID=A0A0W0G674_MONRR